MFDRAGSSAARPDHSLRCFTYRLLGLARYKNQPKIFLLVPGMNIPAGLDSTRVGMKWFGFSKSCAFIAQLLLDLDT